MNVVGLSIRVRRPPKGQPTNGRALATAGSNDRTSRCAK